MVKLLRIRGLILKKTLAILGILSTLRSATNGVNEILIICISILSMKLGVEIDEQVHVREQSDLCFKMNSLKNWYLYIFPTIDK